jgi:hypothetical protein
MHLDLRQQNSIYRVPMTSEENFESQINWMREQSLKFTNELKANLQSLIRRADKDCSNDQQPANYQSTPQNSQPPRKSGQLGKDSIKTMLYDDPPKRSGSALNNAVSNGHTPVSAATKTIMCDEEFSADRLTRLKNLVAQQLSNQSRSS